MMNSINASNIKNRCDIQLIEEDITCPVCKMIILDPIQCRKCECVLCQGCGEQCQTLNKRCPLCRNSESSPFYTLKVSRFFKNLQSKIILECLNQSEGCQELLNLCNYKKHSQECFYNFKQCPNNGCNKLIVSKEIQKHINECEFTEFNCEFCKKISIRKDLKEHQDTCPMRLMPCKWCKISYLMRDMDKHIQFCDLKTILCIGCSSVYIQRDYKNHTKEICKNTQKYQQQLKYWKNEYYSKRPTFYRNDEREQQFIQPYSDLVRDYQRCLTYNI